jgi:hypothetical protein
VRELNGVNIEHAVGCCDVGGLEWKATDTVIMLMVVVQHLMGHWVETHGVANTFQILA